MGVRILAVVCVLACVPVCGSAIARADDKPWVAGVSEQDQAAALALYEKGNAFFEQARYKEALVEYDQALRSWDHPAIRYNAAVCLFNLDRPVEAYEHLGAALRHGEAPLGPELYKQGLNYQKLLSRQVAELEVICKEPGASVSIDGKHLFDGPGAATRIVAVGEPHQVVAAKRGYQTATHPIGTLPAGEKTTITLELRLLESSKWKPWAVVASGAVVGTIGALLFVKSIDDYERYDAAITALCPCANEAELQMRAAAANLTGELALEDRAKLERIGAYSAIAIGVATVATGVVLVLRNRERPPRIVTPAIGADSVGVTFSAPW